MIAYLRTLLFLLILAGCIGLVVYIIIWMFGHKVLPIAAKMLQYKKKDMEKTQDKVKEILEESG